MSIPKALYKIGQMTIDQKQIFWRMQYCYALIPVVQIQEGHILISTNRQVDHYNNLQPVEIFDLALTINFISKSLQSFHQCNASNVLIQNWVQQSPCRQMIIHIIPRKAGNGKKNDKMYESLEKYPRNLVNQYSSKMNFYNNPGANKILGGIHQQSQKYQTHLNLCLKEEKQT